MGDVDCDHDSVSESRFVRSVRTRLSFRFLSSLTLFLSFPFTNRQCWSTLHSPLHAQTLRPTLPTLPHRQSHPPSLTLPSSHPPRPSILPPTRPPPSSHPLRRHPRPSCILRSPPARCRLGLHQVAHERLRGSHPPASSHETFRQQNR